jgi:hypothetical protein
MSVKKRWRSWLPVVVGAILGILASLILSVMSFDAACCVCDTSRAEIYFPYAVIMNPQIRGSLSDLSVTVALAQWPLYGIILGSAWMKNRKRGYLFTICVVLLLALGLSLSHYDASKVATHIVESIEYDPG